MFGFSCRSSRKLWTNLLTLVRLTLRNLTICVCECPSFEMIKGQQSHFHLNGFLLTCELFKVDIIEAIHSESVLLFDSRNWIIFLLRLLLGLGFALRIVERGGF